MGAALGWLVTAVLGVAAAQEAELDPRVESAAGRLAELEEPAQRVALLEELAPLGAAEAPTAQRARVAELLARSLAQDESLEVRAKAAELCGRSPEPDIVLPALLRSARDNRRALDAARKESERLSVQLERSAKKVFEGEGRGTVGGALERMGEGIEAQQAVLEELLALYAIDGALLAAFASLRDDRSVQGLEILLEGRPPSQEQDPAYDALLAMGTAPAVGLAVDSMLVYERERRELEKALRERERERPERVPNTWRGTAGDWEAREAERLERLAQPLRERLDWLDGWAERQRERLTRFAAEKELPAPPARALPAGPWRAWGAELRRRLPDSLGG